MTTFSFDVLIEPTYINIIDIAAGAGDLAISMDGLLQTDAVNGIAFTVVQKNTVTPVLEKIVTTGLAIVAGTVTATFSLASADVAAIAAAGTCSYSVSAYVTRAAVSRVREVQAGLMAARTAVPILAPP